MKFPILTVDIPNKNNRIYPRHVIEKEMERYKKNFISEKRALVSNKPPTSSTFNLSDTIGVVTDMWMEENTVFVDIKFLSEIYSNVAEKFHLRTAGMGTITKQSDGTYKVGDDWEMICCFLTDNPA